VVKIIARLELDETISFQDGHYLSAGKEKSGKSSLAILFKLSELPVY